LRLGLVGGASRLPLLVILLRHLLMVVAAVAQVAQALLASMAT
jgi:hypothetical protein